MSIQKILTLLIAFVLSVGAGLYGGNKILENMAIKNAPVVPSDIIQEDFSDVKAPEGGKTPSNYDALYNYRYAKKKMLEAGSVESALTGDVYSMGLEHQVVRTKKQFDSQNVFIESSSVGTFAKVYSRTFHTVSENFIHRTGEYKGGEWGAYAKMNIDGDDGYIKTYGTMPRNFIPYLIMKDTIKSDFTPTTSESGGEYILSFSLNEKAANNYRLHVRANAESLIMPKFSKLDIKVKIDGNWNIKSIEVSEEYTVKKKVPVLGTTEAKCESTSVEVFTIGSAVKIEDSVRP